MSVQYIHSILNVGMFIHINWFIQYFYSCSMSYGASYLETDENADWKYQDAENSRDDHNEPPAAAQTFFSIT